MAFEIELFICRQDNYGVIVHDPLSRQTLAVDAPDGAAIDARLRARGWKLDHLLITHHHADHTDGIPALKATYGCTVIGPAKEADKIASLDRKVKGGSTFLFGDHAIRVIDTPGHTLGHISYWLPRARIAFTADTLFAMGCGRILEGTPEMMWSSLERLAALPDDTTIYCGHEYTETNARFALTIEPRNAELERRYTVVKALRAANRMTLPTTLGVEKRTNPFLRASQPSVKDALVLSHVGPAVVFAEIRRRKDAFS